MGEEEKMYILTIILVIIIVYFKTLFYNYVCDDFKVAYRTKKKDGNLFFKIWQEIKGTSYYNPKRSHLIVIILHCIVCILIYIVFGSNKVSFLTAILFVLHPSNTECSVWLSGKRYVYASILALLMFVFPIATPLLWASAGYLSIITAVSPIMFISTKWWFWAILPFMVFGFWRPLKKKLELNEKYRTDEMRVLRLRKLILAIKTFGFYFLRGIFPLRIGFYQTIGTGLGVTKKFTKECYKIDRDFWIGLFIVYFVGTNLIFNSSSPVFYGLLWWTVNILPFCNWITISQNSSLRYSYFANIGLCLVLANVLNNVRPELTGLVIGAYLIRLWYYMPAYKSQYWFVEYQIAEHPDYFRGWFHRGIKKYKAHNYTGALYDFLESIKLCPHDCKSNFNAAAMYILVDDLEYARKHLQIARENVYDNAMKDLMVGACDKLERLINQIEQTGKYQIKQLTILK